MLNTCLSMLDYASLSCFSWAAATYDMTSTIFIFCLEGSAVSAIVMSDIPPQFKDQYLYLEKAASHWGRVQ